jgi:VanZ family protein
MQNKSALDSAILRYGKFRSMRPVFFYKPSLPTTTPDAGWRWRFNVWVPVAIAAAVIGIESTNTFSAQNTSGWLRPIVQHIFGPMQDARWDDVHHYIRKTGHFVGYGGVCFTFLRAWLYTLELRSWKSLRSWRLQSCLRAILSTAFIASCDEFHQSFIPSRTGSPVDVLLDTTGAFTLCLLVWLICWCRRDRSLVAALPDQA